MTRTTFTIDYITDNECLGGLVGLQYTDKDGRVWFNPDPIQVLNINKLPDVLSEFINQIPCLKTSETT